MKRYVNKLTLLLASVVASPLMAFAQEGVNQGKDGVVMGTAAAVMALAAISGTTAQGKALSCCLEYIGRNPQAKDQMFTPMIIGLAMIESLVVLSFVIAIMIVK